MTKILVVDDEEMIRFAFEQFLMDEGYVPLLAPDADVALAQIRNERPDIVFLDYRLPGRDGLELLEEIHEFDAMITVVFMTAYGAMDVAIRAMQQGAYEYLTKPLDLERVRTLIGRILEGKRSLEWLGPEREEPAPGAPMDQMVGKGPAMQEVFKMIGLLTTQDVTVLITGESGVGKELVARAIHENSPRRDKPFVAINCGAMPEALLEAEMFGYERGAFTGADAQKPGKFEVAKGGTIFLDEIGDLQLSLQVKLLRVLQEKTLERVGGNKPIHTDARVLAATNKELSEEVRLGRFRKDLFYRLHLIHIHLPPLRERREDIPPLVSHFIRKANREMNRQVKAVTKEAMDRLVSYYWAGNVRELENQIKRAIVLSREDVLPAHLFEMEEGQFSEVNRNTEEQLSTIASQYLAEALAHPHPDPSISVFDRAIGVVEKALIQEALRRTERNQVHAAKLLGINRSTLSRRMKDYNM